MKSRAVCEAKLLDTMLDPVESALFNQFVRAEHGRSDRTVRPIVASPLARIMAPYLLDTKAAEDITCPQHQSDIEAGRHVVAALAHPIEQACSTEYHVSEH